MNIILKSRSLIVNNLSYIVQRVLIQNVSIYKILIILFNLPSSTNVFLYKGCLNYIREDVMI